MSNLEEQLNQAHGDLRCQWDRCLLQFPSFENLFDHLKNVHVKMQPNDLPRDCRWGDRCIYQTNEKKHMISHLRSHLDWRPYSCDLCESKFKHEHEIRRHKDRLHSNSQTNVNTNSNPTISPINNQNLTPPPLINSSHSSGHSPNGSVSFANVITPEVGQDADKVLIELIEYALGYRKSIEINETFKSQLFSMALPLSILDIPQSQLRRCVIDSFHQSLLLSLSSAATSNNNVSTQAQMNNFDQTNIPANLFNPDTYLNHEQPLINGFNINNLSMPFSTVNGNGFNMNFSNGGQLQNMNQFDNTLYNFPTPPNFNNYNSMNNNGYIKQDPNAYNIFANDMINFNFSQNQNMDLNQNMFALNSRSVTPPGKIKQEYSSPDLSMPTIRTRGLPHSFTNKDNTNEGSSSGTSPPSSSMLSSIMPNFMSFLKIPNAQSPTTDNSLHRNRSVSPVLKPSTSPTLTRSTSDSKNSRPSSSCYPRSPSDPLLVNPEKKITQDIYSQPKEIPKLDLDMKFPIIRQDDGSYDIYEPRYIAPKGFQRSASITGNCPLEPEEYLALTLEELKI